MPISKLKEFVKLEASSGILLFIACIIALVMKNSPAESLYDRLLITPVVIQIGEFSIDKPLLLWINDGLMAIFFLLVGLEIKRELLIGQLAKKEQVILPLMAALGGIIFPALIYVYFNFDQPETLTGWAIPAATDIAFALGIIALLGSRIPEQLKICLLAIAILDDVAAVVIIALFYTHDLSLLSLGLSIIGFIILWLLNRKGVTQLMPYLVTGTILWACVLKSGVHATLAGIVIALFIPLQVKGPQHKAPLARLEHELHPWVAFGVLPIFAFANAGVSFEGLNLSILSEPITLGIIAGLFIGKQAGVMILTKIGVMLKWIKLPYGVNWKLYYGMALITGVGFTMSLFIGTLAFDDVDNQSAVRLGVLCGSGLSGLLGYLVLRLTTTPKPESSLA